MVEADLLAKMVQLGPTGVVFMIWYFDSQKQKALQDIIREQVADKQIMREERTELIRIIREQAAVLESVREGLSDVMEALTKRA